MIARELPLAFITFAEAYLKIIRSIDDDEKVVIAASLLSVVAQENDLVRVARWLSNDSRGPHRVVIPASLPVHVYAEITGDELIATGTLDQDLFLASRSMAGSSIEAIRMLLEARQRVGFAPVVRSEGLTISQVAQAGDHVGNASGIAAKTQILIELWRAMDPSEIAVFHLIYSRGTVAGGLSAELLSHALARAFDQPVQRVRHALAIDGDSGVTARSARRGELGAKHVRPMQPIAVMNAQSVERVLDDAEDVRVAWGLGADAQRFVVEERLPGVRIQLHAWAEDGDDDGVRIALLTSFGRDLAAIVPALVARTAHVPPGTVIDGQLIAYDDDGIIVELRGLERAALQGATVEGTDRDALYIGFDLLVHAGLSILDDAFDQRRLVLEHVAREASLPITRVFPICEHDDLNRLYVETMARGGLGVIAKRRDSTYEFGRRSAAWLKAPGDPATLLAVIRYASAQSEVHEGRPGELTFGIWLDDSGHQRLVNIGRAECGLGGDELERFSERLRALRGKRFGSNYEIEPGIVCELEYDAVRVSARTDAGYTIRIACIRCVRWDLVANGASSVADVAHFHRMRNRARTLEAAVYVPGV